MRTSIIWLILVFILGVRFVSYIHKSNYVEDSHLRLSGTVLSEPRLFDNGQSVRLANFSVYLPKHPLIKYGDYLVVEGYLKEGVLVSPVVIKHLQTTNPLFHLRENILTFYESSLPSPDWGLVAGMVVGSSRGISKEFWELLTTTGTAHVVVASGTNVTLVAGFAFKLMLGLISRKKAILSSLLFIWLYVGLSGFDAPLVRAGILTSIVFSAQVLGKQASVWRALVFTGLVMLLVEPFWIKDLGFVLSFAATASLILFGSKVDSKLQFVPKPFREGLSTSIAAQVFVLPILFFAFGRVSILAPIANALILFIVPWITVIGIFAGVIGTMIYPIGKLIILLVYPLTQWFIFICNAFGKLA